MYYVQIPRDWVTASLPHDQGIHRVGLFGRIKMMTCSCGITVRGGAKQMWQLHVLEERKMKEWLRTIQQTHYSGKSGPFYV